MPNVHDDDEETLWFADESEWMDDERSPLGGRDTQPFPPEPRTRTSAGTGGDAASGISTALVRGNREIVCEHPV